MLLCNSAIWTVFTLALTQRLRLSVVFWLAKPIRSAWCKLYHPDYWEMLCNKTETVYIWVFWGFGSSPFFIFLKDFISSLSLCDCSLTVFGALSSLLRRSSYRVVLNEQLLWRRVIHWVFSLTPPADWITADFCYSKNLWTIKAFPQHGIRQRTEIQFLICKIIIIIFFREYLLCSMCPL